MDDAKPPPNADDELEPQDAGHGEEPDRLGDLLDEIVDPQFEVFARLIRNEALGFGIPWEIDVPPRDRKAA